MNTHLSKTLPRFVNDLLAAPPSRGEGLNLWLFRTARVLWPYRNRDEIFSILEASTGGQARPGEIARAVARSEGHAWQPGGAAAARPASPWPVFNPQARADIVAGGPGWEALMESSPVRFPELRSYAEETIDALFPGNPLLCVGKSATEFATRPREVWRGRLAELSLIVPNPMKSKTGLTQDGRRSEHCMDNTGPRRFLVIEQDRSSENEQAAVIHHLAGIAPLALVVHSGGKSLHGWFYCQGRPEEELRRFMAYAVHLGADRATWPRCHFVRQPGGRRSNGNHQEILYFAPGVLQ